MSSETIKTAKMSIDDHNKLIDKINKSGKIKDIDFEIKIGNKIKCVDPYGSISEGEKYKIKDIINNKYFKSISLLELEEIPNKYFRADCFSK